MKDIMGLMKQAKQMQSKMAKMQEQIGQIEVEGSAGADMVKVTLSGKGELKGVFIDPSLLKEGEAEMIEDLLIAAHAQAKDRAETALAEKTSEITSGLSLPPGMKLPF